MPIEMYHHYTAPTHYKAHNIPAHMATTVSPGNHYKVRMPTMQAAINAALAGGSSSTKQGHPIVKASAMRHNGIPVKAQTNAISL